MTTLDILIPSYRANEFHLTKMLDVPKPEGWEVKYIIVVDNPKERLTARLDARLREPDVLLIRNKENFGAAVSRNIALDASSAEWALFWDDDIEPESDVLLQYAEAVAEDGDAPGFLGPTLTPPPCNSFTQGVLASDILTFWHIPAGYQRLPWGITANLLIRRSAVSGIRFLVDFPKNGGGEDIDFCLRIVAAHGRLLSVVWSAKVRHGWWREGRRDYVRFMRWAYGDSVLSASFPRHRYLNFPNPTEFIFAGGAAAAAASAMGWISPLLLAAIAGGGAAGEFFGEWMRLALVKRQFSPLVAAESSLVRAVNDFGRFAAHVRNCRLAGFMERFDYFCDGCHVASERKWGAVKFSWSVALTFLFQTLIL